MIRIFAILMVCAVAPAQAITVEKRDSLKSLCTKAPHIVHAVVTHAELIPAPNNDSLPTMCYTLRNVAHIKGSLAAHGVPKLCYLGDVVSETRLVVAGLRYPQVGEQAIFFVKDINGVRSISPLQGWNQGHIALAEEPSGRMVVATATGRALCAGGMQGKVRNSDADSLRDLNLEQRGQTCQKLALTAFIDKLKSCGGSK